jgi:Mce-associated membrane protein
MPPSRRRPGQQHVRRPKVAGIRRPEGHQAPAADAVEQTDIIPKVTDEVPEAAPTSPAETTDQLPEVVDEPVKWGAEGGPDPEPVRPKPSGRRRPSPTRRPESVAPQRDDEPKAELPAEPGESAEAAEPATSRWRGGLLLPVVLGVVAVLLGGLAAWFGVQTANADTGGTNTALTDSATTSEVSGQITSAVNTIFSYNYTDMAKTQRAVQQLLTGTALCQYNALYKIVQQQAPSQKLVLTTTVQDKGVEMLQGDTARVLLLVQQHDTRASTNQQSDSQSMIAVNAVKQGATWKISAIDTFNGSNPTNCPS